MSMRQPIHHGDLSMPESRLMSGAKGLEVCSCQGGVSGDSRANELSDSPSPPVCEWEKPLSEDIRSKVLILLKTCMKAYDS